MKTFSKLDEKLGKLLTTIAGSEGFLDFSERDAATLDRTRKAMYAELQEALGPMWRVDRELEAYGETAWVIFDGERLGEVIPNTVMGTMDYMANGGRHAKLTDPSMAKVAILSLARSKLDRRRRANS